MYKKIIIAVVLVAVGYIGGWFQFEKYPLLQAEKVNTQYQQAIESMACMGKIVELDENSVTIDLTYPVTGIKKYALSPTATGQIGNDIINPYGQKLDITESFKVGQTVRLLANDNTIFAITKK